MASLYKRATRVQRRMLAVVEGAVINAAHFHPENKINERFARSVAKRAVGTLSAMPEVLAAGCVQRSPKDGEGLAPPRPQRAGDFRRRLRERMARHTSPRHPLDRLHGKIASQLRALKIAGEVDLVEAYIDVLRAIAKHRKKQ